MNNLADFLLSRQRREQSSLPEPSSSSTTPSEVTVRYILVEMEDVDLGDDGEEKDVQSLHLCATVEEVQAAMQKISSHGNDWRLFEVAGGKAKFRAVYFKPGSDHLIDHIVSD